MTVINVCLAVVAFGLLWPVIVFAICCASMGRLAEPFPVGEWYGQTLPPLAGDWLPTSPGQIFVYGHAASPATEPLPVAAVPCLQEGWVREVMASIEAAENTQERQEAP